MAVRKAKAEWNGDLKGGKGTVGLAGGAWEGQYSFTSRFEEGSGTNPEELIAAAHAGVFFHGPFEHAVAGRFRAGFGQDRGAGSLGDG